MVTLLSIQNPKIQKKRVENFIPNFRERKCEWKLPFTIFGRELEAGIPENDWEMTGNDWEWEWQIPFPNFGNGIGKENSIPNFRERELEAGIPENDREREFPLTPA